MAVLSRCVWLLLGLSSVISPVLAQNSTETTTSQASTQTSTTAAESDSQTTTAQSNTESTAAPSEEDFAPQEIESGDALGQLQQMAEAQANVIAKRSLLRRAGSGCSASNIRVRQEWYVSFSSHSNGDTDHILQANLAQV